MNTMFQLHYIFCVFLGIRLQWEMSKYVYATFSNCGLLSNKSLCVLRVTVLFEYLSQLHFSLTFRDKPQ